MSRPLFFIGFISLFAASLVVAAAAFGDDSAPRIEPEQLKEKINQPELILFDVRIGSDWKKSKRKITGALRVDPHDVSSWAAHISKRSFVVVYCS